MYKYPFCNYGESKTEANSVNLGLTSTIEIQLRIKIWISSWFEFPTNSKYCVLSLNEFRHGLKIKNRENRAVIRFEPAQSSKIATTALWWIVLAGRSWKLLVI